MKSVGTAVTCLVVLFFLIVGGGYYLALHPFRWLNLGSYSTNVAYFTCKKCGSTKHVEKRIFFKYIPITIADKIKYQAPCGVSCKHKWRRGISTAALKPVVDGAIVLVRKKGKYGACIFKNQQVKSSYTEYEWWYQADGSGCLDKSLKTVSTGSGVLTGRVIKEIKFVDVQLSWSISRKGVGHLYYKKFPGEKAGKNDLYFCITKLKSLKGVDAADSKWDYKATPK